MLIPGTRELVPTFSCTPQRGYGSYVKFKKYVATTFSFEPGEREVSSVAVWNEMHKIVAHGKVTAQNTGKEGER